MRLFNLFFSTLTLCFWTAIVYGGYEESLPIKLANMSSEYGQRMGVVYTKLDPTAYNSITQGVPNSELLFEIKRNRSGCFANSSNDTGCTSKIKCHRDNEHSLLLCPVSIFNTATNQQEFLLENSSDDFYIQVVLKYPRIITHEMVREVIEKSPIMNLGTIKPE